MSLGSSSCAVVLSDYKNGREKKITKIRYYRQCVETQISTIYPAKNIRQLLHNDLDTDRNNKYLNYLRQMELISRNFFFSVFFLSLYNREIDV